MVFSLLGNDPLRSGYRHGVNDAWKHVDDESAGINHCHLFNFKFYWRGMLLHNSDFLLEKIIQCYMCTNNSRTRQMRGHIRWRWSNSNTFWCFIKKKKKWGRDDPLSYCYYCFIFFLRQGNMNVTSLRVCRQTVKIIIFHFFREAPYKGSFFFSLLHFNFYYNRI